MKSSTATPGRMLADKFKSLPFSSLRPARKIIRWLVVAPVKTLKRVIGRIFRQALFWFKPARSAIGVHGMMGAYLRAFYPKLIELDADVYHAHELWCLESCALAASRLKRPLIYDSHELEAHRNIAWSENSNRARLGYEQRYIRSADLVMTVSEGCARTIEEIYSLDKVGLVRNAPMLESQVRSEMNLRTEIDLHSDVPLLVYTGSVTFNRGLDLVLTALTKLPDFHLVTVGPWNESEKQKLLEYARKIGVGNRFHMHEKVSPEELIDFISSADVAVIPIQDVCLSYRYCMPNKLFEAAFSGLPVVTSNLPDMAKFVEENNLGATFETDNYQSLATIIRRVYEHRDEYVSTDKTEDIRARFCFEHEARFFIDFYKQLSAKETVTTTNRLVEKV